MRLASYLALCLALITLTGKRADADVRLPKIFGDQMVLQQEAPVRIFGFADAGEAVSVELGGQTATAKAGDNGRWRVNLPAMKADGKSHTLTVKGNNTIQLKGVLLGEVWICSGQSNMEWPVTKSLNPKEEIAAAKYPNIRLFNVQGHISRPTPQDDVPGSWQACTPQSIPGFSAVGYFFGRHLHKQLDVPIGLIGSNWGGTRIEPWTPPVGFQMVPELKDFGLKNGATKIYNGMIHGLAPLSVRGAIWYQGESNGGEGESYYHKTQALIGGWRKVFENDKLAFHFVQLANFQKPNDNPAGGNGWSKLREAQRKSLTIPHTGMAVIIDIGAANNIHPKNKQDVGLRLAYGVLNQTYGKTDVVASGPLYKGIKIESGKARIAFDRVGSGLIVGRKEGLQSTQEVADGKLARFAIAGVDKKWYWAEAKIDGDTVVVSSKDVPKPVAVRYGYSMNPTGANLYNKEGLPASPFRTDNW